MPVPAIMKHSEEVNADLIVMGTHGRGGLSRVMLGSVTERILRETKKPLLAVRVEGSQQIGSRPIERILCPVNFTDIAKKSAKFAIGFAHLMKAELTLLHIASGEESTEEAEEKLDEWHESVAGDADVTIRRVVGRGAADEQVIRYALAEKPNLIVIGAQHKIFFDTTILGTTTIHVIRHAPSPVLTVVGES